MKSICQVIEHTWLAGNESAVRAVAVIACAMFLAGSVQAQPQPNWNFNSTSNVVSTSSAVGIGTTSPGQKFEVSQGGANGGMILRSGGVSNYTFFAIGRTTADPYGYVAMAGGPGNFAPGAAAGDMVIRTDGTNLLFTTDYGSTPQMYMKSGGGIGIGTITPGQCGTATQPCLLTVNGAIGAGEIVVINGMSADYVFDPNYRLAPLQEVAAYIQEHHHLPEIPSAAEVKENGVSLGDMQAKLLAKIEELTLHLIQADERSNRLEGQNRELRERVNRLEVSGVRHDAQ